MSKSSSILFILCLMLLLFILFVLTMSLSKLIENSTLSCMWTNISCRASFSTRPKSEGRHNVVFKGRTFSGEFLQSEGYKVYIEVLRSGAKEDRSAYIDRYREANNMAAMFRRRRNELCRGGKPFRDVNFTEPGIAVVDDRAKLTEVFYNIHLKENDRVVFEDRLTGKFTRFISDSGNVEGGNINVEVLESFCHYSYHESNGKFLVCGLKGVADGSRRAFWLSNPTIHSRNRSFGDKDTGQQGINLFFQKHTCTELCAGLQKPGVKDRIQFADLPLIRRPAPLVPSAPPQNLMILQESAHSMLELL